MFGSLYTKGDSSCSSCSLVEQWDTSTFALVAPPRSAGSKLLLLPDGDARAMQVAVLCATRTAYFIYLLEPARLVTVHWRLRCGPLRSACRFLVGHPRLPISCRNLVQPAYLISKDVVFTCCQGADPINSYEVTSKPTIESEPTGTTCKSASTFDW